MEKVIAAMFTWEGIGIVALVLAGIYGFVALVSWLWVLIKHGPAPAEREVVVTHNGRPLRPGMSAGIAFAMRVDAIQKALNPPPPPPTTYHCRFTHTLEDAARTGVVHSTLCSYPERSPSGGEFYEEHFSTQIDRKDVCQECVAVWSVLSDADRKKLNHQ